MKFKVYDNGGATADRYTIVPVSAKHYPSEWKHGARLYSCLGCNNYPEHPQGVSMFSECVLGRYLGKRIEFEALPANVQAHALSRLLPEVQDA